MSDGTKHLGERLNDVMQAIGGIPKRGYNKHHDYYYSLAADVFDNVRTLLAKNGVWIKEAKSELDRYEHGHAVVRTTLVLTDGKDTVSMSACGEGADKGDKAVAKGNTCGTKYALAVGLLLSWGDDDIEADSATDKASAVDVSKYVDAMASASNLEDLYTHLDSFEAFASKTYVTKPVMDKVQKAYDKAKAKLSK